jgi:superfamily II DNA/RNA helicase
MPPEEREARIRDLTADEARRPVLVATDCLSEGVNLQEHFQAVVHYDLAWNPTRHEQREGRVDRFGQRAPVVRAVTLYGTDNGFDGIVLDVLLRKHEQIRKALGISVPVPDRSDDVVQAILEGLLLRDAPGEQLAFEGIGLEKRTDLHREWDSAAAQERQSRTKYAALAIWADTARGMTPGPQAEIQLALARWLTSQPIPADTSGQRAAAIAAAVTAASAEPHPELGAHPAAQLDPPSPS